MCLAQLVVCDLQRVQRLVALRKCGQPLTQLITQRIVLLNRGGRSRVSVSQGVCRGTLGTLNLCLSGLDKLGSV